jgi:hypothetical protein
MLRGLAIGLSDYRTLKLDKAGSSNKSVNCCQSTRRHMPEDVNLNQYRFDNRNSHINTLYFAHSYRDTPGMSCESPKTKPFSWCSVVSFSSLANRNRGMCMRSPYCAYVRPPYQVSELLFLFAWHLVWNLWCLRTSKFPKSLITWTHGLVRCKRYLIQGPEMLHIQIC